MDTLISVIVPVYKVEKYLDRCVESIVAQSYTNLEILLVDDGSPDRCGQMCDDWAKKDKRIKVIHKDNGGLSDARNAGVSASVGEYCVFVDSDDTIAPFMVERLYCAVVKHNTKLAICDVCCIDDSGASTGEAANFNLHDEVLSAEQILPRFYQASGLFYIVAWNKLYHRSLLIRNPFPVGKWHEDEFVAAQIIWDAQDIACVNYAGYCYVTKRVGSIMAAKDDMRHLDALEALLVRYRFYQDIGQNALLHETRARVLKALENYYWGEPSPDSAYHARMEWIRQNYGRLTGLPLKERLKWMVFQISPKLEKWLLTIF